MEKPDHFRNLVTLNLPGFQFFHGEFLRRRERISSRNFHIGLHSDSLPIGLGDWVDSPCKRHSDHKVIIDAMPGDWVGTAPGDFADDRGAFEIFQVVGEFLGT